MSHSLYVYGVLRDELPDAGTGLADAPVTSVKAGALFALVSQIPSGPVARSRRNMIAHTAVLERAVARADVLPLRFGTLAPDLPAVASCVVTNAEKFAAELARIEGRVELGLKAGWRNGVIFSEIINADPELMRLRDRLRTRPATETYFERVELGRRVEAALVHARQAESAIILAAMSPLADVEKDVRAPDEDMIFNRAFLIRREQEPAFDAQVQAAGERFGSRVEFRYVGPVPPYNFVDLQVSGLHQAA